MNPTPLRKDPHSSAAASPSRWSRITRLAAPALTALALHQSPLQAGELYLDFATTGGVYAAGWTPVYAAGGNANVPNVGGSGYDFSFTNVGTFQGGASLPALIRGGFHDQNIITVAHTFTLSGLNPGQSVGLYACAAWDGNAAGGYIVYGDTGPAGVKAQTIGDPGANPTRANLTYIGSALADGFGAVSGELHGRNGVGLGQEGQVGAFVFVPAQTITATAGADGTISPAGTTDVNAGDDQTYTITPNGGFHIVDVLIDGVSVGATSSYTFTNVQADRTIHATFAANTFTRTIIASAGPNGTISPVGTVTPNNGVSQPFHITPDEGHHIVDVLVDGVSVGAVTSYIFANVSANHTISATFAIDTYIISASAGAGGWIDPAGDTVVESGDYLEYAITPDEGYYISSLTVDGVSVAPVPYYSFGNVTSNHTISATFDNRERLYLDFTQTGGAHAAGWTPVYANTMANTMVDAPNVGGTDYGLTFGNVAAYDNGNATQPLIRGGFYNIGGTSVPHPFTLTGLIPGQSVSLYASAAWDGNAQGAYIVFGDSGPSGVQAQTIGSPGYTPTIGNLTLIGTAVANGGGTVSGNMYGSGGVSSGAQGQIGAFLFAFEVPPTWTIAASAGPNGSISPSGNVSVASGGSQSFTITPNGGYHVSDVLVDGVSVGAVTSYDFPVVTADRTISAVFAANTVQHTITASAGPNGSISPSGAVSVFQGVNQPFTITPAPGHLIADVLVDGVSVGAVSNYTFTNVSAAHTIAASFIVNTFPITATAGPNGSISPSGVTQVAEGGNQTYTITPAPGYQIDELFVDGVYMNASASHTFTNVTAAHTISVTFDNRSKLRLDFTLNGGAYADGWTPVYANQMADTMVDVSNVGGSGYNLTFDHVGSWQTEAVDQPLTRSGFYTYGNLANEHAFTLSGLQPGQEVTLYACAGWDVNMGGYVVFGDNAPSGVKAQTMGNPGTSPSIANFTQIGTAVADASGVVAGSLHSAAGVDEATEGQVGAFIFAIADGGAPPATPFSQWASANSLTGNDALPGADPDDDGVSNLLEFALNADPNSGSSLGLQFAKVATVDGQSGVLTLTIAVRDGAVFSPVDDRMRSNIVDGIVYTVEGSADMANWGGRVVTEVTGADAGTIQTGLPPIGSSDWVYKTFRTEGSAPSTTPSFIRVGVE